MKKTDMILFIGCESKELRVLDVTLCFSIYFHTEDNKNGKAGNHQEIRLEGRRHRFSRSTDSASYGAHQPPERALEGAYSRQSQPQRTVEDGWPQAWPFGLSQEQRHREISCHNRCLEFKKVIYERLTFCRSFSRLDWLFELHKICRTYAGDRRK